MTAQHNRHPMLRSVVGRGKAAVSAVPTALDSQGPPLRSQGVPAPICCTTQRHDALPGYDRRPHPHVTVDQAASF